MKKFKCTVTRETTMEIEIDDSVWTPDAIRAWSKSFYDADDLKGVVEHVARLKSKYEDGEFIEGFGIPMIDGKKPYPYIEDNQMAKDINICNQSVYSDIDVEEL
ncbi:hypothetical protein [Enterocloster bolteae]|uniref:Phage protein n=2 Tax=Enterocloster bolteae TaxID=208479 RepID=A0A414AQ70_9FIRM|nr:hypothetical protein [Enterocloster bolteae]ENZ34867.1 hypothetical protein HMPREF1097_04257 [Enterocloster bolteae 90B8]RGO74032.1 hypothetical protein DXB04_31115 [Enterocloster bolteae]RHC52768.1 hypothetical protein DW839_22960 [Enterocloster bolteae]